jgi:hypothetical protein
MKTLYLPMIAIAGIVVAGIILFAIVLPSSKNEPTQPQGITNDLDSIMCKTTFKARQPHNPFFPNGTALTINEVPVFLMQPNSTGTICIQNWSIESGNGYSGNTTAGASKGDSIASDITIIPHPDSITIDNTNKTIAYTISTSNEANGFYRVSPMFFSCSGIPLAVGYNSSHVFDDDFPWLWETLPCPFSGINTKIVGLTNIDVAYITKVYSYQFAYNITNSSVVSIHHNSKSQEITFSFNLKTFGSPVSVSFDDEHSSLLKFSGNPKFERTTESNSCRWFVTGENLYGSPTYSKLSSQNSIKVDTQSKHFAAYSDGTFSLSIHISDLPPGYYALEVAVKRVTDNDKTPAAIGIAYDFPVKIGTDINDTITGSCDKNVLG